MAAIDWPRITVITPTLNQGRFIRETFDSILGQDYPNLQYLVVDGGSTDETLEIIRQYDQHIDWWVSEPDGGQAEAINKALARADGEFVNWINSDDLLAAGALHAVAEQYGEADLLTGVVENFRADGYRFTVKPRDITLRSLIVQPYASNCVWHQPAIWFRTAHLRQLAPLDQDMHYLFDMDLLCRYLRRFPEVRYIGDRLCRFRLHEESKTVASVEGFETDRIRLMHKLLADQDYLALHEDIDWTCRRLEYDQLLWQVQTQRSESRWRRSLRLVRSMVSDPAVAWNKHSRRALRRCLFRGGHELPPKAPYQYQ